MARRQRSKRPWEGRHVLDALEPGPRLRSRADDDDGLWFLPDRAGCTWEGTFYDGGSGQVVRYELIGLDAQGRQNRWATSPDGHTFSENEADFDANGCRTRWWSRQRWDDEVSTEELAAGVCSEDGTHVLATGTRTEPDDEVWDYSVEAQRVLEQGLPVLNTEHARRGYDHQPSVHRESMDWSDGRLVGYRAYYGDDLDVYQGREYHEDGLLTYEFLGDEDWEEHVLCTLDELGRWDEVLDAGDAAGTDVREVLTYEWNADRYTADLIRYDWDGDGVVDFDIPYVCSEGWPWSCAGVWWEPDGRLAWTETYVWSCGGAP